MDNTEKKRDLVRRCVVKAIMLDKVDPNEISIEAIHASSIRLITNFLQQPSPNLANVVVTMLDALAKHDGAFRTDSGYNVYQQAALIWRGMVDNMTESQMQEYDERIVH